MMYSLSDLTNDVLKMGVKKGDTLLIRADLGSIGKLETKQREDYVNFLLDAVGEDGTIVGLSFTSGFFIKGSKNVVFDGATKSYTGAFANTMLKHEKSIRSMHPTNSYVAIGKHAEYITKNHDETSGAYEPIRKIIELNGKMILIGCVKSSPGFTTTHLAEVDLGLNKRIIFPSFDRAYYKKNNELMLFKRKDAGSCSSTFYRFYGYYVKEGLLIQNYIGSAYSIMINAKESYKLELKVLADNPKITICDNQECMLCRARRWDNIKDIPFYVFRYISRKMTRKMK